MSRAGVLVVLLVASLIANIYLVLTRTTSTTANRHAPVAERTITSKPVAPVASPPAPPVVPASYAMLNRGALEKRLADAEAKLEKYLPLKDKFESEARSPETEVRARKLLDKVFGALSSSSHSYDVECHGAYCKLDVLDDDIPTNDWMSAVQSNFAFRGWSFGRDGIYTSIPDPAESARGELISAIVRDYQESPAIAACAKQFLTSTTMMMHVSLESSSRRLVATMDDALAAAPVGTCLRKATDDLLRTIEVPREVQSLGELPLPFPIPAQ